MLPETVDAPSIYRGDGWSWTLEFFADEDLSEPIDLTGYGTAWKSQARIGADITEFAIDDTDAAAGRLVLSLTHVQTASIVFASVPYDLQVTPDVGEPVTLISGTITVAGEVTQ